MLTEGKSAVSSEKVLENAKEKTQLLLQLLELLTEETAGDATAARQRVCSKARECIGASKLCADLGRLGGQDSNAAAVHTELSNQLKLLTEYCTSHASGDMDVAYGVLKKMWQSDESLRLHTNPAVASDKEHVGWFERLEVYRCSA